MKVLILWRLKYFINKTKNIPRLNSGGCGICAYYITRILTRWNQKFEVVYLHKSNLKTISTIIKNNFKNNSSVSAYAGHIMILYKGFYIDGKGIFISYQSIKRYKNFNEAIISINSANLLKLISKENDWNNSFDRNKHELKIIQASKPLYKQFLQKI